MLTPETLAYGTLFVASSLMHIRPRPTGHTLRSLHGIINGRSIDLFTLKNSQGMEVSISEFGATLTSIRIPNIHGCLGEVTLGLKSLTDYATSNQFLGSTVGRFANRLDRGRLSIDGHLYKLALNNHGNHLHGGFNGFDKAIWSSEILQVANASCVRFTYVSPAGEEGYPGTLQATVTYTLHNRNNELTIEYAAMTDTPTACNLTNHAFFNLAGEGTVLDHRLTMRSNRFVPVSSTLIPTGQIADVQDTPFDFRIPYRIGARIGDPHTQLRHAHGYDHCFDLGLMRSLKSAAFVSEPISGRTLEVLTDAPGLQFYSGNFLDGTVLGRWSKPFAFRQGFCLEPGIFPDSPNQSTFQRLGYPSGILRPNETYSQKIVFRFGLALGSDNLKSP